MFQGNPVVFDSLKTHDDMPVASTPPAPGFEKYVMSDQLFWPGTGECPNTSTFGGPGRDGTYRSYSPWTVSYTHLDVYKRQA